MGTSSVWASFFSNSCASGQRKRNNSLRCSAASSSRKGVGGKERAAWKNPEGAWVASDEAGVVEGTDPDPTTPPHSCHMALVSLAAPSFPVCQPGERERERQHASGCVRERKHQRKRKINLGENVNLKRQTDRVSTSVSKQVKTAFARHSSLVLVSCQQEALLAARQSTLKNSQGQSENLFFELFCFANLSQLKSFVFSLLCRNHFGSNYSFKISWVSLYRLPTPGFVQFIQIFLTDPHSHHPILWTVFFRYDL